jgi:predicted metal-dependent hydrolase
VLPKPGRSVEFDNAFFVPSNLNPPEIKDACIQIYRLLAGKIIKEKTRAFAQLMSADYVSVRITGAQKQWGSCSARKRLSISWRLMMAEDDLIDYVVVHELAHIFEMNHSRRFWAIVEGVLPDYESRRKLLKDLQQRLSEEEWG